MAGFEWDRYLFLDGMLGREGYYILPARICRDNMGLLWIVVCAREGYAGSAMPHIDSNLHIIHDFCCSLIV
jgi:hypothetical protein